MNDINVTIQSGEAKRLKTAGRYCENDIVVTVTGDGAESAFEAGKQAEHEAFWNSAVPYPTEMGGTATFAGYCWNDETFKPPFKITLYGNLNYCFLNCHVTDIRPYVNFNNITALNSTFQYAWIKVIPFIDASSVSSMSFTFDSTYIESIEGLTVAASTKYNSTFASATKLKHVIFSGTIGQNGLSLAKSTLLDKESITSIINTLSDTTSGLSVTLSETAVNNAFTTDEWNTLIATKPNWTISLM